MEALRDIVSKIKLFCGLEIAIVDKLEEYERRIYKLEEDNKRLTETVRVQQTRISELIYAFGEVKRIKGVDSK